MDATPDPRLFADLDQILVDAHNQITEEAHEETLANIGEYFHMTPRQAALVLAGTIQSIHNAAGIAGLDVTEFLALLTPTTRAVMLAFTAGAVNQHDIAHGLDPATGETRPA